MKKLMIVALILGASHVSFGELKGQYGFERDETGEKFFVENKTDGTIFFGVYRVKNDEIDLFGDIYSLPSSEKAMISRPLRKSGIDRRLYFASKKERLSTNVLPDHDVAKNKQFIKIGNWDGESFVIKQEMLK